MIKPVSYHILFSLFFFLGISWINVTPQNIAQPQQKLVDAMDILLPLMHLPGIVLCDNEEQIKIRIAALLDFTITNAKSIHELMAKPESTVGHCLLYEGPKAILTSLGTYYDAIRLFGDPQKNKNDQTLTKIKLTKISQIFQLALEIGLRICAYFEQKEHPEISKKIVSIADWVEIWRLICRLSIIADVDITSDQRIEMLKKIFHYCFDGFSSTIKTNIALFSLDEESLIEQSV